MSSIIALESHECTDLFIGIVDLSVAVASGERFTGAIGRLVRGKVWLFRHRNWIAWFRAFHRIIFRLFHQPVVDPALRAFPLFCGDGLSIGDIGDHAPHLH